MDARERVEAPLSFLKESSDKIKSGVFLGALLFSATLPLSLHAALLSHRLIWANAAHLTLFALLAAISAGFILLRTDTWEFIANSRPSKAIACMAGTVSLACSLMSVFANGSRLIYIVVALASVGVFVLHGAICLAVRVRDCLPGARLLVGAVGVTLLAVSKCLFACFGDLALPFLALAFSLAVVAFYLDVRPFVAEHAIGDVSLGESSPPGDDLQVFPRVLGHDLAGLMQHAGDLWNLTPREREILPGLAHGHSIARIAEAQGVSVNTVRTHVKGIYAKACVHSQQELMSLLESLEAGLVR